MLPRKDDIVRFTKNILSNTPFYWMEKLKDKQFKVLSCKLSQINSIPIYKIAFLDGGRLLFLDLNIDGKLVNNGSVGCDEVFEYCINEVSDINDVSAPIVLEEANSKCPICGKPALDLIFSVRCTNSGCRNYK